MEERTVLSGLCRARAGQAHRQEGVLTASDTDGRRCDLCGQVFPSKELRRFGTFLLCTECGMVYCDACYREYGNSFIEENAHIFYTGWFEGLSDREQLEALKAAYRAGYRAAGRAGRFQMREGRREFCSARVNEAWPDYVAKRLNGAYNGVLN